MGKRGPRKTPTPLKLARGTYRKSRDGAAEVGVGSPVVSAPKPPSPLGKEGLRVWKQESVHLVQAGILNDRDLRALHTYCRAFDEIAALDVILSDPEQKYFIAESGYVGQHPAVNERFKWLEVKRRYEAEFGLTPSARASLGAVATPSKQNSLTHFKLS